MEAGFQTGRIYTLLNQEDLAFRHLKAVRTEFKFDKMSLVVTYPDMYCETLLLLAEMCISKKQNYTEASDYLLEAIIISDYVDDFLHKSIQTSVLKCLDYKYRPTIIDTRKKEYIVFQHFIGFCYMKVRKHQEAFEAFSKASEYWAEVKQDTYFRTPEEIKYYQGQCKMELNQFDEALKILESIRNLRGGHKRYNNQTHQLSFAFCFKKYGQKSKSEQTFSNIIAETMANRNSDYFLANVRKCLQMSFNAKEGDLLLEYLHNLIKQRKDVSKIVSSKMPSLAFLNLQSWPRDFNIAFSQFYNSWKISRILEQQVKNEHGKMQIKDCSCNKYKYVY
jgi:tetratricopeptide (TPR) repeat protein